MIWFHCTTCDTYSKEPDGFNELKHFAMCPCGLAMYMRRIGHPKDGGLDDKHEVQGILIAQSKV